MAVWLKENCQPENWNITRRASEGNIPVEGLTISDITTSCFFLFYYTEKTFRPTLFFY